MRVYAQRRARDLMMWASQRTPLGRALRYRGPAGASRVALSFDDGPHPEHTPAVLAILERRNARATFFVLGRRVLDRPDLVRRIRDAGHDVGIHGFDHSLVDLYRQVRDTRAILERYGVQTREFRPPHGRLLPRAQLALAAAGYRTVLWSFDSRDSLRADGKCVRAIDYGQLGAGDIALFHDDNPVCVAELPAAIDSLRARGLEPATVTELLDGRFAPPAHTWSRGTSFVQERQKIREPFS